VSGTHFTLLVFGDQPVPPLPAVYNGSLRVYTIARPDHTIAISDHTLVDSDGFVYRAYGITDNALILVRPDGYIGRICGDIGQDLIIDYLRNVTV
jgi:hypothetical protein